MIYRAVQSNASREDYAVLAVDPKAGNDSALLTVFNNQASAERMAERLNFIEGLFEQCHCSKVDPDLGPLPQ